MLGLSQRNKSYIIILYVTVQLSLKIARFQFILPSQVPGGSRGGWHLLRREGKVWRQM